MMHKEYIKFGPNGPSLSTFFKDSKKFYMEQSSERKAKKNKTQDQGSQQSRGKDSRAHSSRYEYNRSLQQQDKFSQMGEVYQK